MHQNICESIFFRIQHRFRHLALQTLLLLRGRWVVQRCNGKQCRRVLLWRPETAFVDEISRPSTKSGDQIFHRRSLSTKYCAGPNLSTKYFGAKSGLVTSSVMALASTMARGSRPDDGSWPPRRWPAPTMALCLDGSFDPLGLWHFGSWAHAVVRGMDGWSMISRPSSSF
jgi:hypothetical protein